MGSMFAATIPKFASILFGESSTLACGRDHGDIADLHRDNCNSNQRYIMAVVTEPLRHPCSCPHECAGAGILLATRILY